MAIKQIMRRTNKSRGLVRQVVRGGRADIFRSRMSSPDPFLTQLETAWTDGSRNGAALWRAMRSRGFTGSLRVVTEWTTRKRKHEGTATREKRPSKTPSARRIARMMTVERDTLSKAVARTVAIIGVAVPDLTSARDLLEVVSVKLCKKGFGDVSLFGRTRPFLCPDLVTRSRMAAGHRRRRRYAASAIPADSFARTVAFASSRRGI
jgi:hypothetical protein